MDSHIIGKTPAELSDLARRGLLKTFLDAPEGWIPPDEETQYTRDDLASMTPEQIVEADRLGQLSNLYTQENQ